MQPHIPLDKSILHRVLLLQLFSDRPLFPLPIVGNDVRATWEAVQKIREASPDDEVVIDCASSGTTLRLLMGLLAGRPGRWVLVGSPQLDRRPVDRVGVPLRMMGAEIHVEVGERRRIIIDGRPLRGISYTLPVASAQLKSAVLLAGLHAEGVTEITEPTSSRDHTERLIAKWGGRIQRHGDTIRLTPSPLHPCLLPIPSDISSAAFLVVAAILTGRPLCLKNIGLNPTRIACLAVLQQMGARLKWQVEREDWEPMGSITVEPGPHSLQGAVIQAPMVPTLIDEIPILMIAGLFAELTIWGVSELRYKESNRLEGLVGELRRLGAEIHIEGDCVTVHGGRPLHTARVNGMDDHRVVMAMGVLSTVIGKISIEDVSCVAKSYPDFWNDLASLQRLT